MKNTVVELRGGYGEGAYELFSFEEDVHSVRNREPSIQHWPGYAFVRIPPDADIMQWKIKLVLGERARLLDKQAELNKELEGLTKLMDQLTIG